MSTNTRTIKVDFLTRVEGEGALTIRFKGKEPKSVELRIFEPPRFFEGFLRGRSQLEAPDVTARICGICPVAYQMSACHAIEDAAGVELGPELRALRRLLYCGEWIESHVLHMFMLHAPDFLGYPDAIHMAKDHGELVKASLRMKKAGNAIVNVLGGREIHPINVCVGGFYRAPTVAELRALHPELSWSKQALAAAMPTLAGLPFPDFERPVELVSLKHPDEYPFCEGRIVSSRGLDIDVHDYEAHFEEQHVAHSTALHSVRVGHGPYVVGPLARFNLCFTELRPFAREVAESLGLRPPLLNPFKTLLVRGVETLQALDEAIALIEAYQPPARSRVPVPSRAGVGRAATEAPRGTLYHRYRVDAEGLIEEAKITPPTSQNQKSIEDDLFSIATRLAELPHEEATRLAEQTVRNYDPCISCSTHFLRLRLEQEG
ncbi:MAG: Ni/Fe hydrogenase subunit alpha [Sorangiineae bacterium PRO1]|nr:Ni/Fe hydrogenase subunit alpha [Sorangiineae bacterium PRO1]